jgi:hypothetical protein
MSYQRNNNGSWFGESAGTITPNLANSRSSFEVSRSGKSFQENFNELYESYKSRVGIDIKRDLGAMVGDKAFMESYKVDLLQPIYEGFRNASANDPHIESFVENVERLWDAKVRSYNESASTLSFLPIATLEFPTLAKQFFQSIIKDVIEVETTKTPNLAKHIKTTYLVDNTTGDEYEYPKCIFDGTWEKIWDAAKGHVIKDTVVAVPAYQYDIIDNLTDGIPGQDRLSYNIKIVAVEVATKIYKLKGNGITVEFSTGGTFVNGDLDFVADDGTIIKDSVSGKIDFKKGTVNVSACNAQVTGVVFEGYLSNELNTRTVSVREKRELIKFTIEDGARWNMPFSIEEIEDAAALLDINYYNRMVDEIVKTQEMIEGQNVLRFLDDEYKKYAGTKSDIYKLESLVQEHVVDLKAPVGFAGDPFIYKANAVQFAIKGLIYKLCEAAKLDNLSFVIAGNPMACQLISKWTTWNYQQGASVGGITVNNSYGFATDMSAPVRVVASNVYKAYTDAAVAPTNKKELVLRIYAYPTDDEHISFKHLKYTSHLMTSQSQTAYESTNRPGGAYTIVTATSRYKDISVQGIQARLVMLNSADVYGEVV